MDTTHGPGIGRIKRCKIFKTGEAAPIKIGVHACHVNPYLHKFFELILIN